MDDLPWHDELIAGPMQPLTAVAAPLKYAFPIDAALKLLKFHRRLDYAPALGELLWRSLRELLTSLHGRGLVNRPGRDSEVRR